MGSGRLYVVATPIGNLEDVTRRAERVLGEVDLIAAEDTRHSRVLLAHLGIDTPLTSYHDHNEAVKSESLLQELEGGRSVALITDAGTPCISDPGYRLVRAARDRGIAVVAVPGPSALVAALSVSGLPTDRFAFHGFFPRKKGQAQRLCETWRETRGTHLFFESANRLAATLACIEHSLPEAEVAVARELTKKYEEVLRGAPRDLATQLSAVPVKGECVVMVHVSKAPRGVEVPQERLKALVDEAAAREGLSRRDAIRKVAEELDLPRNRVYAAAMERS